MFEDNREDLLGEAVLVHDIECAARVGPAEHIFVHIVLKIFCQFDQMIGREA